MLTVLIHVIQTVARGHKKKVHPAEKLAIVTFRPPGDAEYHSSSTGWTGITVDGVNCWQLSVQPASWGNSIRYPVNSWLPDAEGSRLGGAFTFDPHITLLHPRRSWAKTRRWGSLWERAGRGAVQRPQRSYGQVGQAGGLYRDTHPSGAAQVWCQTDARADRWHNSWIIAWLGVRVIPVQTIAAETLRKHF